MKSLDRIPYYEVKKGRGYWEPSDKLKKLGFTSIPCGPDGAEAQAIARTWAQRAKETRAPAYADRRTGYVYFLCCGDRVKVGFTRHLTSRMGCLVTGLTKNPGALVAVRGTRSDEQRVHDRLAAYRTKGEWFVASEPVRRFVMRSLAFQKVDIEGPESKRFSETVRKSDGQAIPIENMEIENA